MDRDWATWLLKQACESARIEPNGFVHNVLAGLEIGRAQYGDTAYRGRDNNRMGLEEARDAAAYALMEIADMEAEVAEGKLQGDVSDNARQYLLQALRLSAEIDLMFRMAKSARRG